MSLISGEGWAAIIQHNNISDPNFIDDYPSEPMNYLVPIVAWMTCGDTIVGYILTDFNGEDLPYPVPAPNCLGFLRYVKLDEEGNAIITPRSL